MHTMPIDLEKHFRGHTGLPASRCQIWVSKHFCNDLHPTYAGACSRTQRVCYIPTEIYIESDVL